MLDSLDTLISFALIMLIVSLLITIVVQMVAFSERGWQLPRYLETMEEAGLQEVFLPVLKGKRDGRLWRSVPGRRWYSDQRGATPGSQEVVLIHRKRS